MIRRLAVSAAVALSAAALAVPASAAPVCMQIVDDPGDGAPASLAPASRDSLDVLSADIATGKKNLVAAMRLKSVAPDSLLVGGAVYLVRFTADGTPYELSYRTFATGETEALLSSGGSATAPGTPVQAVVDASTSTITWYVPRKAVAALKKSGIKLTALSARTAVGTNAYLNGKPSRGYTSADLAETPKSYTDLTPTCLKGT